MSFDIVIVGAGIVGASTAWQLQQSHPRLRILLLEKESAPGQHQTGRSSGVIHAGVYYEPGSLKAQFCRAGLEATLAFCREHAIPYSQCGKLLVATNELELERMTRLGERCAANGIDFEVLDQRRLREAEPAVAGLGAIHVPATGSVSFRAICRRMLENFTALGGSVRFNTEVSRLTEQSDSVRLQAGSETLSTGFLLTCAGLQSDRLARQQGFAGDYRIVPFRGEFFALAPGKHDLIRRHIYPIPDPALPFVGIHLTRMIDGGISVGPNAVLALAREGYGKAAFSLRDFSATLAFPGFWRLGAKYWRTGLQEQWSSWNRRAYLERVRQYCPSLDSGDLRPHPAGIRAQAVRLDGAFIHDFLFAGGSRTLHVCNAPSPAATSAIPIGAHLVSLIQGKLQL